MVSFTANSLLARCGIAAVAYYLPQDLGIGAILALNIKSNSDKLTGIKDSGPPLDKVDVIVKNFMVDHGFPLDSYRMEYSPRHTVVEFYFSVISYMSAVIEVIVLSLPQLMRILQL